MSPRGRRRAATLALSLLVGVPAVTVPPTTGAAQEQEPGPQAVVTLAAIDPAVASGTEVAWALVVEHDGDEPWTQVEVVAELHAALGSRSALRTALAGGAVPRVVQRAVVAPPRPAPLLPGSVTRIAGAMPLSGSALTSATSAVHPLRLRVLADGAEVGRLDTAIVRVGATPLNRLATTLVWPVDAPPARDPDGDPAGVLDALTGVGGRLDTLAGSIAGVAGVLQVPAPEVTSPPDPLAALAPGVALAVPAHLLEDLARRSVDVPTGVVEDPLDGPPPAPPVDVDEAQLRAALLLERLRGVARGLPGAPLATPYGDADLPRLLASGRELRPLASLAILEGVRRVPTLLGREPASVLLLDGPVAPASLDLLPTGTVLLPYSAIAGPDLALDVPLGEPVRTLRSPGGRVVTALVGDPYLTLALGASTRTLPGDPVRAAHEVMVRTAMVHLEAPGRADRALVLLPPTGFDPDPRFAAELLARLAAAPWLAPTPPDVLAAAHEAGAPEAARLAATSADPIPARLVTTIAATERDLRHLVGAIDPELDLTEDVEDGVPVGARTLADASDELLRATSRAFATDPERAVALLTGVRAGVDAAFGVLTLDLTDVTLTDRDGTVPIGVAHVGGVPIRVRIEVTGPSALTWTDGRVRELTLDPGSTRSLEVPVRSGATGRFPVTVRVTDPSGERLLASDVVGLRATALAGPALALISVTVLLLVVVGTLRQRRRGLALRRAEPPRSIRDEEVER